ncbi:hypothetical protein BDV23DRAFT_184359 [Aspergillus alliaceus]|uniref:Lysine-specific metallo-endopeptidase domain-containing protein n=1 Tax=Petromyces alliaceus TaxID=209559 RepID=A0A5N7C5W9_PETAA|nr:hypothetical protein BDV23DRAFT_184359 [Aspergillus alliaceus]
MWMLTTLLLVTLFLGFSNAVDLQVWRDAVVRSEKIDEGIVLYSARATFKSPLKDAQLVQLAKDAYDTMQSKAKVDNIKPELRPKVMVALAVHKEVFLSSSAMGPPLLYDGTKKSGGKGQTQKGAPQELISMFNLCSPNFLGGAEHQYEASCGDINAFLAYYARNRRDVRNMEENARPMLVVWGVGADEVGGNDKAHIMESCYDQKDLKFGCGSALEGFYEKIDVVKDVDPEPYDKRDLQGIDEQPLWFVDNTPAGNCHEPLNSNGDKEKAHKEKALITWSEEVGKKCEKKHQNIITEEFTTAIEVANTLSKDFKKTKVPYHEKFFDKNHRKGKAYDETVKNVYKHIGELLQGKSTDYKLTVNCNFASKGCAKDFVAFVNEDPDKKGANMTFCPQAFDPKPPKNTPERFIDSTKSRLAKCKNQKEEDKHNNDDKKGDDKSKPKDESLRGDNIVSLHRSLSMVIIHECCHTTYSMKGIADGPGQDYAYGYTSALKLAEGKFDRNSKEGKAMRAKTGRRALCNPDGNWDGADGICKAELSFQNPDSWALVAAGVWFEEKCGIPILLPEIKK